MERFFRALLAVFLTTGLTACSLFSANKEPVRTPKALTSIQEEKVQLATVWSRNTGKGVAAGRYEKLLPAVSGERVFVTDAEGTVSAFARKDGTPLWRQKLNVRVGAGVTVGSGLVLLGTLNGEVIALSEEDGRRLWKTRVSSEVLATPVTDGTFVIVKTIDDKLTALDSKTGAVRWVQATLQPALTLRGSSSPVISREAVFSGYTGGDTRAFRLKDGLPLWSARVAIPKGSTELERMVDIDGAPLIVGDSVFVVSYQGNVVNLDLFSGQVRWTKEISSYQSMAEGFGSLYLIDQDSLISSLDQRSGSANWRQEALQYRLLTAPATFSNYVIVADYQGYLHLLSQVDGNLAGRFRAGSAAIRTAPVVDNDMLFVLNEKGQLMALKTR